MTLGELKEEIDRLLERFPGKSMSQVSVEGYAIDELDIDGGEVVIRAAGFDAEREDVDFGY